jgi:protein required for attachment to host cells
MMKEFSLKSKTIIFVLHTKLLSLFQKKTNSRKRRKKSKAHFDLKKEKHCSSNSTPMQKSEGKSDKINHFLTSYFYLYCNSSNVSKMYSSTIFIYDRIFY